MKYNPFETIAYWLKRESLTAIEKKQMRQTLLNYVTTHPVKSGIISPYTFRYAMVALASLVIVLGGSIGVSNASQSALPNQKLYPVKLWIEEFKSGSQKTPVDRIAFETNRIETRFNEATQLAIADQLDNTSSQIIQSGIEHSRQAVRIAAEEVQNSNPEIALAATNDLETTFSSNGKILGTIERNTHQKIGPIVLAAQVTTENLALEKMKYEKIILSKSNASNKDATEKKLNTVTTKLQSIPIIPLSVDTATPITGTLTIQSSLVEDAKRKIGEGSYSEALVSLQKAEQVIDESKLTKTLEATYNVITTPDPAPTPLPLVIPELPTVPVVVPLTTSATIPVVLPKQ